jgi:hypothetical protein
LGYFYVYLDYFYPKGGTGVLAALLKEKILALDAEIKLNKHIIAVNPAEANVTDSEGNHYPYDHLIWAADLKTLYRSLNPAGLAAAETENIEAETQRVLSAKGAESVYILFAGVDRSPAYFQANGGEHMFYTPFRQGLGETIGAARERIIEDFDKKSREEILEWLADFAG